MMATASICQIRPTLKMGSKGSDVEALQEQLNLRFGYHQQLLVDGRFGPRTEKAVKVVQYRSFLEQDGIVGSQTWAALCGTLPPKPTLKRSPSSVALVQRVQQVLKDGGYYNSTVDGIFGQFTETAVKALQIDFGLSSSGIIDSETWFALAEVAAVQSAIF